MNRKRSRSELKRQAILDAAKKAFQEHGVQGTSMDMLAAMAEVSKRTVYNHFESKEALFSCLISELWQQATKPIGDFYDPASDLHPQLRKVIEAELDTICSQEHIALNRVGFGHFLFHPEALQKELSKFTDHETAVVAWIKAAAKDNRLIPLDPAEAGDQIHHLLKGKCFWPQLLQIAPVLDSKQQQELADQTAAIFLSHYQRQA